MIVNERVLVWMREYRSVHMSIIKYVREIIVCVCGYDVVCVWENGSVCYILWWWVSESMILNVRESMTECDRGFDYKGRQFDWTGSQFEFSVFDLENHSSHSVMAAPMCFMVIFLFLQANVLYLEVNSNEDDIIISFGNALHCIEEIKSYAEHGLRSNRSGQAVQRAWGPHSNCIFLSNHWSDVWPGG